MIESQNCDIFQNAKSIQNINLESASYVFPFMGPSDKRCGAFSFLGSETVSGRQPGRQPGQQPGWLGVRLFGSLAAMGVA